MTITDTMKITFTKRIELNGHVTEKEIQVDLADNLHWIDIEVAMFRALTRGQWLSPGAPDVPAPVGTSGPGFDRSAALRDNY